jgi:transmembrane sensor
MEHPDHNAYSNFSSRDFICDTFFQDGVINPGQENTRFWDDFLVIHPHQQDAIQTARTFLLSISFREDFPAAEAGNASWEKIMPLILQGEKEPELQPVRSMWRRNLRWIAAALFIGALLTIGFMYVGKGPQPLAQHTSYGETRNIVLPDGSVVTLNANSSLEYKDSWKKEGVREVWLKGEGYFNVKHLNQHGPVLAFERFRVHTDNIVIEVLGTTFDVRERRGITEVVLESGSVKLLFRNPAHGQLIMKPGEVVVYDPLKSDVIKDTTSAVDYSAWKKNKLILRDPTVHDITRYLEDNFGYKIVLEDKRMGDKVIEGPILYNNLDDALFILSTVLNTKVIKKDSTILLRPR